MVSVRYLVDDVNAAFAFYAERLGFGVDVQPAPGQILLDDPAGTPIELFERR